MSVPKFNLDLDPERLEALRASEACLRGVFSAMAEGLIIYDSAGRVVEANRSAERILGLSREQIFDPALREPGWRLVREDGTDLPRQEQLGMITLRTGVPGSNHVAGVRLPGGALRWIRLNSQPVTLGSARKPDFVVLSFDDITEALSMTAELRRARADFEAILHNVPAHITSWRRDRTLRFANRAALEHFGLEAGQAQDMSMREMFGAQRFAQIESFIEAALSGYRQSHDRALRLGESAPRHFHVQYVPDIQDDVVVGLYILAVDITELRNSYERVRELAQSLETVREDLRRSVAVSLHEGIAQDLFAAKLSLEHLMTHTRHVPQAAPACDELAAAIQACMNSIRQLANDLRPEGLAHNRLASVLSQHVHYFGARAGLEIDIAEAPGFPPLDEATRLVLFRAAQEILTNVAKHASARSVAILLRADAQRVTMQISDDGVGIEAQSLKKLGSLGLLGIRERMTALGGGMSVRRDQPRGTTVTVYLPLSSP